MYGNKSNKKKADGSRYKSFYYYGCKHCNMTRGHKCDYKKHATKRKTLEEIESLDPDDKHYKRRKADLDDCLYRMYDKIDDAKSSLIEARAKKQSIEAEKVTGDNIYKVLIFFDKFYGMMNEEEQRKLLEALIQEIQIYEERQSNGQWLKSITFRLPIIEENMQISIDSGLDNDCHIAL